MYERYFELSRRPFLDTPDVDSYVPVGPHEETLAILRCFVREGDGVAAMIGEAGSGKTLLCHRLADSFDESIAPVFVTNTHGPKLSDLFQAILFDLSASYEGLAEHELRLRLTDLLWKRFRQGTRTVLFVDEAQHLTPAQLEELRMLTNLENRQRRALQVLLVGQMELSSTLAHPTLLALRQRIAMVTRLRPLETEETLEYVRGLVRRAGGSADTIFTAAAFAEIHERAGGRCRRINQLCHRAMLLAYARDAGTIEEEHIVAAARQLCALSPSARDWEEHHVPSTSPAEPSPTTASTSNMIPHDASVELSEAGETPAVIEVGVGAEPSLAPKSSDSPTVVELDARPIGHDFVGSRFRDIFAP